MNSEDPTDIDAVKSLIDKCRYETDIDKRIIFFQKINAMLPTERRLKIPSLITGDYINKSLDIVLERLQGYPT